MCALLHICCAIIIFRHKRLEGTPMIQNKAGKTLLFVCVGEFFAEILDAGYHIFLALVCHDPRLEDIFFTLFYHTCWFIDLSMFSRPCLLFLMSKSLRKAIYQRFSTVFRIFYVLKHISNDTNFPSKTGLIMRSTRFFVKTRVNGDRF
uniref:Uncharacterized protein n=1 Tax=Panagrolaimus sp. JU765 TaxID=591449 RepID=A0AC34QW45_9BILA